MDVKNRVWMWVAHNIFPVLLFPVFHICGTWYWYRHLFSWIIFAIMEISRHRHIAAWNEFAASGTPQHNASPRALPMNIVRLRHLRLIVKRDHAFFNDYLVLVSSSQCGASFYRMVYRLYLQADLAMTLNCGLACCNIASLPWTPGATNLPCARLGYAMRIQHHSPSGKPYRKQTMYRQQRRPEQIQYE